MLYTVNKLIEDIRSDLFDKPDVGEDGVERDALWSYDDLLRYYNEAAAQLASDLLSLRRRFVVDVLPGQATVRFPFDQILDELQVSFTMPGYGRLRHLRQFDVEEGLYVDDYGLQVATTPDLEAVGVPSHFSRDYEDGYMRLWKVPHVAGRLEMIAIASPPPALGNVPLPFQHPKDRALLLMWMKKLAYEKHDADTLDLDRAREFEGQYREGTRLRRPEIDRQRRDNAIMRPR